MSKLSASHFHDEGAARVYLEGLRWPNGPVCPHCGTISKAYATKRAGKYRCGSRECRKDFTVKVGTVFESSHIPLHKWLLAAYLLGDYIAETTSTTGSDHQAGAPATFRAAPTAQVFLGLAWL